MRDVRLLDTPAVLLAEMPAVEPPAEAQIGFRHGVRRERSNSVLPTSDSCGWRPVRVDVRVLGQGVAGR